MQRQHSQGTPGTARTRDGRELFFMERPGPAGGARATVVFEGGLGSPRSYWALVQQAVSGSARTVVYDRSGLGRSAPDPSGRRRLPRLADDLNDLLDHLGPGPFVLVGHSWGGPVVRLAAAARPGRIAGLVLVDPTDEDCDLLFDRSIRRLEKVRYRAALLLARLGLFGLLFRKVTAALPADAAADMRAEAFTVAAVRTMGAEQAHVEADLRALLDHPPALGDIPLTVISATLPTPGMSAEARKSVNASHAHRARQSPRGRHVPAPRADHMVPTTEPGIIVTETERLLGAPVDGSPGC
ncbi:alpha/beta hydrolase [Streptomyces eurocidicus]|uniref:Alpha/beta hydrolase n=1 Tax=Streptomyces eurocidicus TaxID=66423 RepID=A0A2N8NTS8_STREU|nr:alpha/beta hydrolase [Streptomyces eurocidicus]MBB5119368.1 pimeloyl-ACP methyl ester carboxylesterase [Streptomyces eurocidicus]MBF6053052.1 alpha/beta fold hydrolase [Streptomyces eurocidicus]PNE32176.1 alpha/beta hydrolase [Streptomyces eurocidicus]